jgi:hypothetical protein
MFPKPSRTKLVPSEDTEMQSDGTQGGFEMRIRLIAMAGFATGSLALLAACGGTSGGGPAAAADNTPQVIKYTVDAPDSLAKDASGVEHDTFIATTSTLVQVGRPVTIVVDNYDTGQHGMFFADLGLNQVIKGSEADGQFAETTFTFTPTKAGQLRWYCPIPCDTEQDGWAMSAGSNGSGQDGFMAGYITVK